MITAASFPTPALALRTIAPHEDQRVRWFAHEQAAVAETLRRQLADEWLRSSTPTTRIGLLHAAHADLIRWRHALALRTTCRLGRGLSHDPSRFITLMRDGGRNYDRIGYLGRLRDGAHWDAETRTFRGGRGTPAHQIMLRYGRLALDRFATEGACNSELANRVTLPDGTEIIGNSLARGEAAERIAADLVTRIASRGGDTSQMEIGGNPIYVVSASDNSRDAMFRAAMRLLASAEQGDVTAWQSARYLLYQSPVTKKGADAVTRTFLVVVGAVLFGEAPILEHDVDLRCLVLGQAAATAMPADPPIPPHVSGHHPE